MPDRIDVVQVDLRWEEVDLERLAGSAFRTLRRELELGPETGEFSLLACDDRRMAELNGRHLGKQAATNVLAWPASDAPPREPGNLPAERSAHWSGSIGDIALAYDTCSREAAERGIRFDDHVTHLVLHALLHLLGYRHGNAEDAEIMRNIEISALAKLGIGNPY